MPLHLLKLCVGASSISDLEAYVAERLAMQRAAKAANEHIHTTRMMPTRTRELLDGGSLYWVIKGHIAARQTLTAIRPVTDGEGIARCQLVLDPQVVAVMSRPCRPFQGWRYLPHGTRPTDLGTGAAAAMPERLRFALRELCLI